MADQQSMQMIMQALQQGQGGGGVTGDTRMYGPGFGTTGPGVPVNPLPGPMPGQGIQPPPVAAVIGGIPGNTEGGVELQGMYPDAQIPGMPIDYRNPMDPRFDPRANRSTSQPNGDFNAVIQALMGQGNGQADFLNGLLGGIFGGQRPPIMGRMPSQPGAGQRTPTPGYPGSTMRGPGFGTTGPGVPMPPMRGPGNPGFGNTGPGVPMPPIAGPGGAFGNARTTQPVMNQAQPPTFGGNVKRPF